MKFSRILLMLAAAVAMAAPQESLLASCCGGGGGGGGGGSGDGGSSITGILSGQGTSHISATSPITFKLSGASTSTTIPNDPASCTMCTGAPAVEVSLKPGSTYTIDVSGMGNGWSVGVWVDCPYSIEWLGANSGYRSGGPSCVGSMSGSVSFRVSDPFAEGTAEKDDGPPEDVPPNDPPSYDKSGSASLSSINWRFSLGGWLPDGQSPGSFSLVKSVIDQSAFSKSSLVFSTAASSAYISQIGDPSLDARWQVITPEWVVDVKDNATSGGYDLALYHLAQTSQTAIYYEPLSGQSPVVLWSVQNPSTGATPPTYTSLRLVKTRDGLVETKLYDFSSSSTATTANESWTLTQEPGNADRRITTKTIDYTQITVPSGALGWQRDEVTVVKDAAGNQASKVFERWQDRILVDGNGDPLTNTFFVARIFRKDWVSGSGGAEVYATTTYSYYEDNDDTAHRYEYGRVKTETWPDGTWDRHYYEPSTVSANGSVRLERVYQRWLDGAVTPDSATNVNSRQIERTFLKQTNYRIPEALAREEISIPSAAAAGYSVISRKDSGFRLYEPTPNVNPLSYVLCQTNVVWYRETSNPSSPDGLVTNLVYRYGPRTGGVEAGRISARLMPDGKAQTNRYSLGSFDPVTYAFTNATPGYYLQTYIGRKAWAWEQQIDGSFSPVLFDVAGRSTLTEIVQDPMGRVRVQREYIVVDDVTPTFTLLNETRYQYDALDRMTSVTRNGRTLRTVVYSAGRVQSKTDEFGIQYSFTYDALGRVKTSTKAGMAASGSYASQSAIVSTLTYDIADRVLTQVRTAGGLSLSESTVYDGLGRVTSRTDENGLVTASSYQNDLDPADGLPTLLTVNRPDTGTLITSYYLDGQVKATTGTGADARFFKYAAAAEPVPGSSPTTYYYVLEEKEYLGVDNGPRYLVRNIDWAGREFRQRKPAFSTSGADVLVLQKTYDERGLLVREDRSGLAPKLFEYDILGSLTLSGLDLDSLSQPGLQDTSSDRISLASEGYQQIGGTDFYYVTTLRELRTVNSPTWTVVQETRRQVTGLPATRRSRTLLLDALGQVTEVTEDVDRANRLTTRKRKLPTSNLYAIQVSRNGLNISASSDTVSTAKKFDYDALGRNVLITEANGAVNTNSYITGKNQVGWIQDHLGSRTSFTYAGNGTLGAGQRLTTLYPDGTVSRVEYDVKGRVIHEWGSAGYPVEHEFDPVYGDRIKLRTYRSGTGWDSVSWPGAGATADVTEWVYQAKTGLLVSKKDAAIQSVTYTYQDTASYRLASRVWARSPSVSTTYAYDPNTGELTGISYNDGTPGVTRGYDRAGRLTSVTDAAGSRTLSYSALNELDDEQFGVGQFSGLVLDHGFDAYGRPTSLAGGSAFTALGIAYRTEGRVDKVTSGTLAWTYSYEVNSDRISQVQSKDGTVVKVTQKRGYDILGQLEQIEEQFLNGTVVERQVAGYSYDAMHRRRQKVLEDGSVWSYRYNERGEVVSGKRSWLGQTLVAGQQFEYEYDSIGNRTRALKGGDASGNGLRAEVYSPTALNQCSGITLANAVDVVGIAYGTVGVTVAVNGGVATAAARQGEYYQLTATMGTTGTPTSNQVSVATSAGGAASVGSVYRPPLNQSLVHDADGNLISDGLWKYAWDAENRIRVMYMTNLAAGTPRFQLEFQYDYQGRRIRKTVKARQNDTVGTAWVVWSDRRFIYEGWNLMAELDALNANTSVRSYVWGQDLAGGLGTQGGRKTAGGIGGALATRTLSGGAASLYCYDGNGNVVGLVDATTQTWAARYEYGPFGELIRASGALAKSNPLRFSTKYQDDESELLYYGYRFYNASTGRWLSRDPIAEKGGRNLYGFVANNPISSYDPLGLIPDADNWPWPPPVQPPPTPPRFPPDPEGFAICMRNVNPEGILETLYFAWASRHLEPGDPNDHAYIHFKPCSSCPREGWGIGGTRPGAKPIPETKFQPTSCKPCRRTSSLLLYGPGAGRVGDEASDDEILECIKLVKTSKPYVPYGKDRYQCLDWAKEATSACGLDCK